jgi:hypothetical protein
MLRRERMETTEMQKYATLMQFVKLRMELVDRLMHDKDKLPLIPRFEFVALQFRQILELIAFGSLVANEKVYAAEHADFAKEWNAKKLLVKLEKLNADFYPTPIQQVKSNVPGIMLRHEKITSGFLTRKDFVDAYQECSEIIHTGNPYSLSNKNSLPELTKRFANWKSQIVKLLNLHELRMLNDPGMAVCSMNDGGTNEVKVYRFSPPPVGWTPKSHSPLI